MNKEEQIKYAIDELVGQGNLDVIGATFTADYIAHAGESITKDMNL